MAATGDGNESLEGRIERLETGSAYQEQAEHDFSRQIFEHDKRLERLETRLEAVISQLKILAEGKSVGMPANETPPHY